MVYAPEGENRRAGRGVDTADTPRGAGEGRGCSPFGGDDLQTVKRRNRQRALTRDDSKKFHIHCVIVTSVWVLELAVIGMFLVLLWHFAAPHHLRFLEQADTEALQKFLLAGGVGAGLSTLGRKVFKGDSPPPSQGG